MSENGVHSAPHLLYDVPRGNWGGGVGDTGSGRVVFLSSLFQEQHYLCNHPFLITELIILSPFGLAPKYIKPNLYDTFSSSPGAHHMHLKN